MDKDPLSIELVSAGEADMPTLHSWFDSVKTIRDWGGPNMDYPLTLKALALQIQLHDLHSFKLEDSAGNMLAFGQCYIRCGRAHFARLVVAPSKRGLGLGGLLVLKLIELAPSLLETNGYSLFVAKDNKVAEQLYRSLGFLPTDYPETPSAEMACYLYMTRK
ncbi:GNAT family N-acetyltransferase [Aliiglaciecola sp. LCG003]|uniref:GNAT family N-acetyltransferase n=1 Tax=Aliiglaciecola sp. LCG003 TaxID=3053655 RepID=UPI0025741B04|nr:GNAT family N-acetyltransferase [Aliiglaciecola sp. LCG003]WJG08983.1 GNAT family N-acetyltransferase [Aliiglaciecola sp. LCG003]